MRIRPRTSKDLAASCLTCGDRLVAKVSPPVRSSLKACCSKKKHIGSGKMANHRTAFRPRKGQNLINHHLRDGSQAVCRCRLDPEPVQRCVGDRAREQSHQYAVRRVESVRLNDNSRTQLPIVSVCRDGDNLDSLHGSGKSTAVALKSRASATSGRPRSSRPWRLASAANSGLRGSGTQIRSCFMPRCNRCCR